MKARFVSFIAVVLVIAACTDSGAGASAPTSTPPAPGATASGVPPTAAPVELTILGAASLSSALAAVKTAYETAIPGVTLVISTDSSSALETKIEQGAPADVFLSADTTNPAKLVTAGLADGAPVDFAGNKLTVIVPTDNPAGITSPKDLAKTGVKVIAAGDTVPITRYAKILVANLAKEAGYPTGFEAAYNANVVSMEENVKAVVAKIELGQGDAAICYVTDARASRKVTTIDVPPTANVPASYAGVVVKASANAAAAQEFLTWLAGTDGQAVLATFGFLSPGS
ncbi:MAG: molybdate transport system substrate-binding protein [Chloroflexota bacterium]|jgi:molybdate transport system substrate-binding protein|nr:molybdate transport system substrate-binding protein [Chloroflexota bacterium]